MRKKISFSWTGKQEIFFVSLSLPVAGLLKIQKVLRHGAFKKKKKK